MANRREDPSDKRDNSKKSHKFHLDFLNSDQQLAWAVYQQHHITFLLGAAGSGKSHLAMAFAIYDVLRGDKKKIILTRPVVEAGESLGFLPGSFEEKINPYLVPLLDITQRLVGGNEQQQLAIGTAIQTIPLAYLRGHTFTDAVCILDEAQNATTTQLKLYLTRLGHNSKMIVTGDPQQTDLKELALLDVVRRIETVPGIGTVRFKKEAIVRHPVVAAILERFEE